MQIDLRELSVIKSFVPYELSLTVQSREEENEILRALAYWRQYAVNPGYSFALEARIKARG